MPFAMNERTTMDTEPEALTDALVVVPADVDELEEPADVDELEEDAVFRASLERGRLTTPLTRVLLVLLVVTAGFVGGAVFEKHRHPASAATGIPPQLAQLLAGRTPTAGGGTGTGGALTGTVKLVDGNNVYVQDAQGNVTKVTTGTYTKIQVRKDGTLADLGPSKTVTVQGSANGDGTYTATSVTESSGGAFPGGGGFPGGGAAPTRG
jgi:hypothetical protein